MIHIRELTPDDARAIGRIEALFHGRELADGVEGHRRYLTEALAEGVNLSFGVFEDSRLVGYLLCYGFEPTAFPDEEGDALYVEDIAILPEFRRLLPSLFKRMSTEARRHFPEAALEAHARETIFQIWHKHPTFFARAGYPHVRHLDSGEIIGSEVRYVVRCETAKGDQASQRSLSDLLSTLAGHSIELDGQHYTVHLMREEVDWGALEARWDELLLVTPAHTVFQSYTYQRLWWRHFGGDGELFIVLIVQNGIVKGIAPLQIRMTAHFGRYSRQLSFIGSRWEVDRPAFLFPAGSAALIRVLAGFLSQRSNRWETCEFHEQATGSESLTCLEGAFRSLGYIVGRTRDSNCPYLALQGSWKDFLAGKSQTFRKNLKTAGRKLREFGGVRYQAYDDPADVLEQLKTYRDIEARSWKAGEGVGVSRDSDYFAFYLALADAFGRKHAFTVRVVTVAGKAIAGTFGLAYDGVYYSLQIAHDREFSRCSPGTYLEALEMEECFSRGYREYEFLGGFLNNKSRWTSTSRYTTQLHVYQPTPFFRALHVLLFRIKPLVKELVRPFMRSWDRPERDGANPHG
jgi:CelD/BcsL family acetyltransferase involved in cellulose biosynthesis